MLSGPQKLQKEEGEEQEEKEAISGGRARVAAMLAVADFLRVAVPSRKASAVQGWVGGPIQAG